MSDRPTFIFTAIASIAGLAVLVVSPFAAAVETGKPGVPAKPALTVTTVVPQVTSLPIRVSANGNIAAWQEASIGTEVGGLRLMEVGANVGDKVKRGQVLARFAPETVQADLEEARAKLAEAEANLAEAVADARRSRELRAAGFISEQKVVQSDTLESAARARVGAQRAALHTQQLRLAQTRVMASDNGVISSRSATVGAVPAAGQELFRLIRQGRLEWRAEVASAELSRLKPGMRARIILAEGVAIDGRVRMLAPTVDAHTRNGLVYVDLPAPGPARAGMFARGEIEIGAAKGMTLPQGAVLLREGFAYVLRVGPDSRVIQTKVTLGRRAGDRVEIAGGLDPAAHVVASGGAFLADGDVVRVVELPSPPTPQPAFR
jgi:HlyD family secretion protein